MRTVNYEKFNYLLLSLLFLVEVIDNFARELNYNIPYLKNITLFVVIFFCLIETTTIIKNNDRVFSNQFKSVIKICIVFLLLSLYYASKNYGLAFSTIISILKIFTPAFLSYVILNTLEFKKIYLVLEFFLVFSAIAYFISIMPNINIDNIRTINFINSSSPFESNFFSPTSIGLFMFFFYFDKKKWPILLSAVMVFMTFKRPMIIAVLLSLVLAKFIKTNKNISKFIVYGLISLFSIAVFFYIRVLQGEFDDIITRFFGVGINKLTMGRAWLFENVSYNYVRQGLGTSILNGRTIEMDLIMFYIEMGIISVIAYVYNYYTICERKVYNIWLVTIVLFLGLTSHFYDISFFWILFYLIIGCVLNNSEKIINYSKTDKKLKKEQKT